MSNIFKLVTHIGDKRIKGDMTEAEKKKEKKPSEKNDIKKVMAKKLSKSPWTPEFQKNLKNKEYIMKQFKDEGDHNYKIRVRTAKELNPKTKEYADKKKRDAQYREYISNLGKNVK